MNKLFNFFSMLVGSVGGLFLYLFGGWDSMMCTLLLLIILDYITGVLKALYEKKLSSLVGLKGIIKKIFILILVVASVSLEKVVYLPIREVVIMFFVANEGLSLLENVSTILPVPKKLKNVLEQIQSETIEERSEDKE